MIAALYVQTGGVYYGLDDVDPWDEARDARRYAGPWPVVAHPPCKAWSIMGNIRSPGRFTACHVQRHAAGQARSTTQDGRAR